MKIAFGSDHAGFDMKKHLMAYLEEKGHTCTDLGCVTKERTDYPIAGEKVGRAVAAGEFDKGIVICGTGIGISITANKVKGIRCALCSEPFSAKMSRAHNNANVLAMGGRVIGIELAKMVTDTFLETAFEGGRHARRVALIGEVEADNPLT